MQPRIVQRLHELNNHLLGDEGFLGKAEQP